MGPLAMILFYIVLGSIIAVLLLVTWAACTAGAWADRKTEESRACACEENWWESPTLADDLTKGVAEAKEVIALGEDATVAYLTGASIEDIRRVAAQKESDGR
jgi:hypothetical protein